MDEPNERDGADQIAAPAAEPQIRTAHEEAVAATSAAMDEDPDLDVEGRLRQELAQRNVTITDDRTLHDLADGIQERRAPHS